MKIVKISEENHTILCFAVIGGATRAHGRVTCSWDGGLLVQGKASHVLTKRTNEPANVYKWAKPIFEML
jgi:hypothetical protein